ncbi:hypothetical protein ACFQX6_55565 [Streptosporangium lutulentum]
MLRTLSQAFGSAVTGGSRVPGFAKIKAAVQSPDPSDRGAADLLLTSGSFPPSGWRGWRRRGEGWRIPARSLRGFSTPWETTPPPLGWRSGR